MQRIFSEKSRRQWEVWEHYLLNDTQKKMKPKPIHKVSKQKALTNNMIDTFGFLEESICTVGGIPLRRVVTRVVLVFVYFRKRIEVEVCISSSFCSSPSYVVLAFPSPRVGVGGCDIVEF